jgi:hypothetical protein
VSGVVAQCPACRALVVIGAVVVDGSRGTDGTPRAGLPCSACGALSWLPLATTTTTTTTTSPLPTLTALPPVTRPALTDTASVEAPTVAVTALATEAPAAPLSPLSPPTTTSSATIAVTVAGFDHDTLGRVRARFAAPTDSQAHLAERFDALLTAKWSQEAEHKALLKAAAAAGELAFVGSRYRAILDVVRDEPRARAAQNELLTMAMATMSSQRLAPVEEGTSRTKLVLGAALFVVVGGGLFWFVRAVMAVLSRSGAGGLD